MNNKDAYLCNVWRAIAAAPDEVARFADWPVNETDLFARHLWLVREGRERIARLEADPNYYDAKVAGWWMWGISQWIGGGWCAGDGPWGREDGAGVSRRRPMAGKGVGVHRGSLGVPRQRPHLGDAGMGVHQSGADPTSFMTRGGSGCPRATWDQSHCCPGEHPIYGYMRALQARLRRVRVCCGDWTRVVTTGALSHGSTIGVLLDPPYAVSERDPGCYTHDESGISVAVREWALAHGDDPRMRIALCGYEGEHEMPETWRVLAWKQAGGYARAERGRANRSRERIWFSPHCIGEAVEATGQLGLLDCTVADGNGG